MVEITLDERTHERLRLVAAARGATYSDAVAFLLDQLGERPAIVDDGPSGGGRPGTVVNSLPASPEVDIHVDYKGQRVEAVYHRTSDRVTIRSGDLVGASYDKPSPAARAVVESIAPDVTSNRNGWTFWIVTETGEPLQSIRYR